MKVEVRNYDVDDFSSVRDIIKEAFDVEMIGDINNSNSRGIVACIDSKVIGFLLLTKMFDSIIMKNYYLIDYVSVKKDYQNMGIGYRLINEAEKIARADSAIYLQLTSSRFRVAARNLYEKCGFVVRDSDIFRKVL